MATMPNAIQDEVSVTAITQQFIRAAQVGLVAAAKDIGIAEYIRLTDMGSTKVTPYIEDGYVDVYLNDQKVRVHIMYRDEYLEITRVKVYGSDVVDEMYVNMAGDFWDFESITEVYIMLFYTRVLEGLLGFVSGPFTEFSAIKKLPKFVQYEVNAKGEEVVKVTFEFFEGSQVLRVELFWAFGILFPSPRPNGHFVSGKVVLLNGKERIWV